MAYDNFDNQRLPWIYGPQVAPGGVTGNAGKLPPNENSWSFIENRVALYSKYTMSVKLKLDSTDPNARKKWEYIQIMKKRSFKEVELKGGNMRYNRKIIKSTK
ncbi:hypothetical protein COC69_23305 [Bacillus cereus]|uniref:Uncharacterized protein n=1 Tax=Bacillus cereus TaxID=1396 RepID=A0A9X7CJN5_BACCE|nr:hypothetical protein COC69_23305 [Bacillus cereus]